MGKAKDQDASRDIEYENRLVERVEEAARKGAAKGAKGATGFRGIPINILSSIIMGVIIIVAIIVAFVAIKNSMAHKWDDFLTDAKEQFSLGDPAENHDLVLEDHGIFSYTAADFADAILGDPTQLRKLEIFSQEVVDVATITEAGLADIKIFEKNQMITYHGTAVYTVDLSRLSSNDINLDEKKKTVTLYIPHSEMEQINIPEDQMDFGDIARGWLAFGDIKLTPEQSAEVQAAARKKMEQKLEETNAVAQADRFAKMSVWELYQSVVSGVSPEYTLEIEFR